MAKHRSDRARSERLSTGIAGLDRVLNGGLRPAGMHLIVGGPGAGKTVLAHHIGANLIRAGGRVLYLTSLVEGHQTLIEQARSFSFFDPSAVSHALYYASPFSALRRGGLTAFREAVTALVQQHNPTLLVLDGLQMLRMVARETLEYHELLADLAVQTSLLGATTLLLSSPLRSGTAASASDASTHTADGVIRLARMRFEMRHARVLAVEKMRGAAHLKGWHSFTISTDGVRVFPRVEAVVGTEGIRPADGGRDQAAFGIRGLDAMLDGGVPRATVTLLLGSPGVGKTLLALSFLVAGAAKRQPGLYVGFHEPPDRLQDSASAIGLAVARHARGSTLRLEWLSASEMVADELADTILRAAESVGATRLVIDGLNDLRRSVQPPSRHLAFLSAFAVILRARGLTTVWTQDMPRVTSPELTLPMPEISPEVDNVIVLRHVELRSHLHHLISVLKVRGVAPDRAIRELRITNKGIQIGDVFDKVELLLTGSARGAPR